MPPTPNNDRRTSSAFTLLEIIVVLAIMAVVLGLAIPFMGGILEENRYFGVANRLEIFAITARGAALQGSNSWQIIFYPDHFAVGPTPDGSNSFTPDSSYSIPSGLDYQIQPWPQTIWHSPTNDVWLFTKSGLSQPMSVRLTNSVNDSWLEFSFHPLTGQIYTNSYLIH